MDNFIGLNISSCGKSLVVNGEDVLQFKAERDALQLEVVKLQSELAKAREFARRYQWLRAGGDRPSGDRDQVGRTNDYGDKYTLLAGYEHEDATGYDRHTYQLTGEELDVAVDVAMGADWNDKVRDLPPGFHNCTAYRGSPEGVLVTGSEPVLSVVELQSAPADKGQGEPVGYTNQVSLEALKANGFCQILVGPVSLDDPIALYAEQPATVKMCNCNQGRLPCECK